MQELQQSIHSIKFTFINVEIKLLAKNYSHTFDFFPAKHLLFWTVKNHLSPLALGFIN